MKEIVQYIVHKSETHNENHEKFLHILQNQTSKIGLLIHERMLDFSAKLISTLHSQLCQDVNWRKQENNEDSKVFDIRYLLVLSKVIFLKERISYI